MGRQEDRDAGFPQLADERPGRDLGRRVHAGRWFVEDDELRPPDEGEREAEALLLTAGEHLVACRGDVAQPHDVEQLIGIARRGVEPGEQAQDLARPSLRVDPARLEHEADPGTQRGAVPCRIEAEDPDHALVGAPVALEDLDRRRLARTVRPEEREALAPPDVERQPGDDRPPVVALDEAADLDREVDRRARGHGVAMAAYWRSRSAAVISPIWRERTMPFPSMKYDWGGATTR